MKTERRHELQHNELADWLLGTAERVKPHVTRIAALLLAVLVVYGVYRFIHAQTSVKQQAGWNAYYQASQTGNTNELQAIARDYAGEQVSYWALLRLADVQLNDGIDDLFINTPEGRKKVDQAAANYDAVLKGNADAPLRERALFGLGRCQESLDKLAAAQASYEQLAKEFSKGPFAQMAEHRLKSLKSESSKSFYDWFARQDATPPPASAPATGPAKTPLLDGTKLPDFDMPPASLELPKVGTPKTEPPKADVKPAPATAPAEKIPAAKTPVPAPAKSPAK